MDRLISKEEIERLENIVYRYNRESRGWHDCNDIRLNSNDIKAIEKAIELVKAIPSADSKTGNYEKHIDHTDCIWYGSDSGCPVTCSQYRDGWNDAMDYIFRNGKGYQPYRHDG